MYIDGFIWLSDIVDKLMVKHNVTQEEVEDVFFNRPSYRFVETGHNRVKMFTRPAGRLMPDDI